MPLVLDLASFFFFNDTATTEIYTLSLHDALPICRGEVGLGTGAGGGTRPMMRRGWFLPLCAVAVAACGDRAKPLGDRKSTRLNSSHLVISYAVFCLKKKKTARAWPEPSS